jgi:alpha-tubulin suppressor-like RCC1 family protein
MSGQRSANSEGAAESVAAGCNMRELPRIKKDTRPDLDGLAVFTWGRGEDGQLGLGDTSDQDEPTYVSVLSSFIYLLIAQALVC